MYHPKSGVKCLPVRRVLELIKAAHVETEGGETIYVAPNTIGNLLLLDQDGKPIGIVDFGYDGDFELWLNLEE